jgi:hypothetical protein
MCFWRWRHVFLSMGFLDELRAASAEDVRGGYGPKNASFIWTV